MHIHNPTNEKMDVWYVGKLIVFKPGKTMSVEDKSAANHIMNEYGRRGLVLLEFGDDTKDVGQGFTEQQRKAEAGVKANLEFKRNMVILHNQDNESRKHTRLPYIKPTDQLNGYAKELGIKLIKPYEVDDLQAQEMNNMKKKNDALEAMIEKQSDNISELLAAIKAGNTAAPAEKTDTERQEAEAKQSLQEKISKVHSHQRKDYFKKWFDENKAAITLWPEEAKTEVRKKYTHFFGGEVQI